jgi:hypothetical protein
VIEFSQLLPIVLSFVAAERFETAFNCKMTKDNGQKTNYLFANFDRKRRRLQRAGAPER